MIGPRLYLLGGVAAVIASLAAVIWWQSGRIETLRLKAAALEAELTTCDARVANLMEDNDSDSQVDAMDDLHNIPDGWLLPNRGNHH